MVTVEDSFVKREVAHYSIEAMNSPSTFVAEEGVDGFRHRC